MPWFDLADQDLLLPEVAASSVSSAGDVDGDGVEDLLVYADLSDLNVPEVFLILGGPSGLAPSSWSASGRGLMEQVLSWAGGVGDLNGDGRGELGVAAGYDDLVDEERESTAYYDVYAGAPSGASATAGWSVESHAGMFEPALGTTALAGLGDLNGDGHPELGVALASRDFVRLFTGGPDGPAEAYTYFYATAAGAPAGVDFGSALGGAGDINDDGYDDLWIAADDEVRVYVGGVDAPAVAWSLPNTVTYSASPWATGLGDLDADGFADVGVVLDDAVTLVFGDAYASGVRQETATLAGTRVQAFVSRPGLDVNGDGYVDVLVVDHRLGEGAGLRGELTLWLGTPSGLEEAASTRSEFSDPEAAAGDFDGDGLDDVVLATNEADGGHLRLYRGRSDLAPGTTPSFRDVDGDGYGDPAVQRMTPGQEGWVADGTDCDDTRDDVHPGAADPANDARDTDCDGADSPPDTGEPADTGEPGETGDTAGPADTGDTGPRSDTGEAPAPQPGRCGCSAAEAGAPAGVLAALGMLIRRRRTNGAGRRPA